MSRPYVHNRRSTTYAYLASAATARRKTAPLGNRNHGGERSLDRRERFGPAMETGNGGKETDRIRVLRGVEQCVDRRVFDDFARIHNGNFVADLRNHTQIV